MSLEPLSDDLAETSHAYRRALGSFATGVCVMTAVGPDGPVGITANSFASLSLEPRLVLWSIALASERAAVFAKADRFGVHVLEAGDRDRAERFAFGDCRLTPADAESVNGGAPRLHGALTWLDCALEDARPVGDHLLLVGRVERFETRPGEGLTYFRGRYGVAAEG